MVDKSSPLDREACLSEARQTDPPGTDEAPLMRALLSKGGIGLVLLGEILRDIDGIQASIGTQDLTNQEGVNMALKLQGQLVGLNRVVDRLFEIAEGVE